MNPTLILLAGPNGAGKSTLYHLRVAPHFKGPFVNADIIQRDELADTSPEASYEAAKITSQRRNRLLADRRDFVTETVFSHPSKLEVVREAKARGYYVFVMHISVNSPDLSVARVAERVSEGGHHVPEDKIRARYVRNESLIRDAVLLADQGFVYDNSHLNVPPKRRIVFQGGRLVSAAPNLPDWMQRVYAQDLLI